MPEDAPSDLRLKPLDPAGVDAALEQAARYRLLNEAREAESICRDVLRVAPTHEGALVTLLLSLTDQFRRHLEKFDEARALIPRLDNEFERDYYSGVLCERRAKAHHLRPTPGSGNTTYAWLREAMDWYEKASERRPAGDNDPTLRWNSCVRMIRTHPDIRPAHATAEEVHLLE